MTIHDQAVRRGLRRPRSVIVSGKVIRPAHPHPNYQPSSAPTGWWQALWDYLVPHGYEDEAGFHYGMPPLNSD